MPDYNPAVALGVNATPVQIAPTLNTLANIDLAQAHSGLYGLQALQQQRSFNALQAAAEAYRSGKDPVAAAASAGMDPAGLNQLQTLYANQRAMSQTPGGILPSSYEQLQGGREKQAAAYKTGQEGRGAAINNAAKIAAPVIASNGTDDGAWTNAVNEHYLAVGDNPQERMQVLAIKDPAQRVQIAKQYGVSGMSPGEGYALHNVEPGANVYTPLSAAAATSPGGKAAATGNGAVVQGMTPRQKAQDVSEAEATTKYLQDEGHKTYSNAQSLMGSMVNVDHDVDALGPAWMGTGATAKAAFVKGLNSFLGQFGVDPIAGDKVASSEELGKETIRAGMQLINSNFGGSREAASIIQMGGKAVVGQQNSYLGAKYVSATIKAAAQRQIDLYEYQAAHKDQLPAVSEVEFNKLHPPQQYAMGGIASVIPQAAKDYLAQHPETAPQFNKNFGTGTAQFILANPQ